MTLTDSEVSRVIEMAWEDRTPFEAIEDQFGLSEKALITFMRAQLKSGSFKLWRSRVSGRKTKHIKLRSPEVSRAYCATQYKHR
ncbi:TIGR03643 family protein [Psychromonas sp. B3M02]|uniref:TIGR03643 family protein n=1 Tax=Psychromonas sp. B3M02 TaxID=2267226 RepID=UPI000DEA3F07|nr:TIGR03643 family protein [Psychromonas sp. B3M02]RBW46644.1 TIGR03643 family protein [Psychromonas sp. B3M02]